MCPFPPQNKRLRMQVSTLQLQGDQQEQEKANPVSKIPAELFAYILSWCSGKSLAVFNNVCKLWSYSFTTTAFLLRHSRVTTFPDIYVFCKEQERSQSRSCCTFNTLKLFSFRINKDNTENNYTTRRSSTPIVKGIHVPLPTFPRALVSRDVTVSNFCDGLVCVYNYHDHSPHNLPAFLCSVRIQDLVPLPTTSLHLPPPPSIWLRHWCSLGFEPTRGEYRVLRSVDREEDSPSGYHYREYEILTVGLKSWKLIDKDIVPSSITQGFPFLHNGNFCVNGVIYWLHCRGLADFVIASIDLAREEFEALSVNELTGNWCYVDDLNYLAPLNNHPTLFCVKQDCPNEVLLWQWTLFDHGNLNSIFSKRIVTSNVDSWIIRDEYYPYEEGTMIVKRLNSESWRYCCFDLEKGPAWVLELEPGCPLLRIG